MSRFTPEQYADYLAKQAAKKPALSTASTVTVERELHEEIADYCKRNKWIALHGRMDMATGRTIGEPDFTILADRGRTFYVECKTAKGKVSPEQLALHVWAEHLEHKVYVVRSMDEFLTIVNHD